MSLLSDDEEWKLWNAQGIDDMNQAEAIAFARAYAAAILAKLAAKELPEPAGAYELVVGKEEWQGCPSEIIEMRDAYSADQLRQAHAQGFAAGAAAQLAEKPTCLVTPDGDGFRMRLSPPVNAVPLGWQELYTRREA